MDAIRTLSRPRLEAEGLARVGVGPIDLRVDAGACLAITGPSGAGKSVLLRMLADLDPHEGVVRLDGEDSRTLSGPAWRRHIAYASAEPGWWDEDVAAHFPQKGSAGAETAANLARAFGLPETALTGPVARLSTGERQRLGLIRTLLLDSPVLLLDEPTGPLDPDATARVEAELRRRLASGVAIVLVTHSAPQAERLGAQVLRMEDGQLREMKVHA